MSIVKSEKTEEWFFSSDQYILSETDEKGIIIYANDLFCELAGYTLEELLGQPHNIIRHEDMPKIAFKGLWDDIQTKGFWTGVVKNLRKDGAYYWVYATALKRVHSDGSVTYLSVRRVPDRASVQACTSLYADLKSKE
ncbi:PAS domain-containing protein [Sulfurimonas sp.]|uniref:PAS domain-containing protein n=1 Tax=Sulfurimonas sp. TaxID=2022749 RepID=UPI002B48BFC7|nr:PAS domain-containing protein [Sulfurimonas sp.]